MTNASLLAKLTRHRQAIVERIELMRTKTIGTHKYGINGQIDTTQETIEDDLAYLAELDEAIEHARQA